jgi:hypothetical protein
VCGVGVSDGLSVSLITADLDKALPTRAAGVLAKVDTEGYGPDGTPRRAGIGRPF